MPSHVAETVPVKLTIVDEQPVGALTVAVHGEYLSISALHGSFMLIFMAGAL